MFMDCGLSTEKKQLGSAYQLTGFMCMGKRQQLDPSPQTCSCLQTHCLAKSMQTFTDQLEKNPVVEIQRRVSNRAVQFVVLKSIVLVYCCTIF